MARARQIEKAVVAESARWGDYRRDVHPLSSSPCLLYTKAARWLPEQSRLLTRYSRSASATVFARFSAIGLYPSPVLRRPGSVVTRGTAVSLNLPAGRAYPFTSPT